MTQLKGQKYLLFRQNIAHYNPDRSSPANSKQQPGMAGFIDAESPWQIPRKYCVANVEQY